MAEQTLTLPSAFLSRGAVKSAPARSEQLPQSQSRAKRDAHRQSHSARRRPAQPQPPRNASPRPESSRVWSARTPSETAGRMNIQLRAREEAAIGRPWRLLREEEAWETSLDTCARLITSLDRSLDEIHGVQGQPLAASPSVASASDDQDGADSEEMDDLGQAADKEPKTQLQQAEKALQEMYPDGYGRFNLHNVREVQNIPNTGHRVQTKVKYYRMHDELVSPVMDNLNRRFMAPASPHTRDMVVDIAKVRNARRTSPERLACERSESKTDAWPIPQPSLRTTVFNTSCMSQEEVAAKLRARSSQHAASIARAKQECRRMDLNWRLQMLEAFEARQGRQHQAQQARQCLLWISLAISMSVLRAIVQGFHSSVVYLTNEEQSEDNMLMHLRRNLTALDQRSIVEMLGARAARILRPMQARALCVSVLHEKLAHVRGDRQRRSWAMWSLVLAPIIFLVRLRKPLRKHYHAEIVKDFIEKAWQGYAIMKTMKTYKAKAILLQRGIRTSLHMTRIVKRHIYLPQVWALESQLLLQIISGNGEEATQLADDFVREDVIPYMERCDVERWQKEAQFFLDQRNTLWKAKGPPPALPPLMGGSAPCPSMPVGSPRAAAGRDRQMLTHMGSRMLNAHGGRSPAAASGTGRRGILVQPNNNLRGHITSQLWQSAVEEHVELPPVGSSSMGRVLDTYRPSPEAREEVVQLLWRDNVDRWWQEFREYKEQRRNFTRQWFAWSEENHRLSDLYDGFCPEPPTPPELPQVVLHLQDGALQKFVMQSLREGAAAGLLRDKDVKDVRLDRGSIVPWHRSAFREKFLAQWQDRELPM
mmetsp:Transcript_37721/g.87133  ORF Transcript_37721/g.87133 Transcript_37721/m.87133 type:complete len:821 (-) Transcript_37721:284-2746(-)